MANTAIKSEDEKKEYFDTKEELEAKVTKLAEYIKKSKHFVVFTGGIKNPLSYSWNKHFNRHPRFQKWI